MTAAIVGILCSIAAFIFGAMWARSRLVRLGWRRPVTLSGDPLTLPELSSAFRDFVEACNGSLDKETKAALKRLSAPSPKDTVVAWAPAKRYSGNRSYMTASGKDWDDQKSLDAELRVAVEDDEKLRIFDRWLRKRKFNDAWQAWSFDKLAKAGSRDTLREMFGRQDW